MHFATALVGRDAAQDLVSEVVLACLERQSLSELDNPRAYLTTSMLNRARSRYRRASRESNALQRLGEPGIHHDSYPGADSEYADALMQLPIQQRAALYLVYWEDLDQAEAAVRLGVRPGTLRRYLFLARRRLEELLDEPS